MIRSNDDELEYLHINFPQRESGLHMLSGEATTVGSIKASSCPTEANEGRVIHTVTKKRGGELYEEGKQATFLHMAGCSTVWLVGRHRCVSDSGVFLYGF